MAESEIAELCQRIYRKHQHALDLIYEYRPDQQASIRETLEELIQSSGGLTLDHSSKSYVRFAPTGWDKSPELKSGKGWTPSGPILLFEFANSPDRLHLRLVIGPGPDATRRGLFEMAKAHPSPLPFRLASKSLGRKWNTIYVKAFLTPKDYEDATDDQLAEEIGKHWKGFVDTHLPAISDTLRQEHWLWQHANESEV